jgi:hypothetical protein
MKELESIEPLKQGLKGQAADAGSGTGTYPLVRTSDRAKEAQLQRELQTCGHEKYADSWEGQHIQLSKGGAAGSLR